MTSSDSKGSLIQLFKPGNRVLEIGCGFGIFTQDLSNIFKQVVALDILASSVERTRVLMQKKSHVKVVQGNILHMQFEAKSFDAIVLCRTLHFIEDIETLFKLIDIWLVPGGSAYFVHSPLFELSKGDASSEAQSFRIGEAFRSFCNTTFQSTLKSYWSPQTQVNFNKYCNPTRDPSNSIFGDVNRKSQEIRIQSELPLLDLLNEMMELHIVQAFISEEPGNRTLLEDNILELQREIMCLLEMDPSDLYFEDIQVIKSSVYFFERNTKPLF